MPGRSTRPAPSRTRSTRAAVRRCGSAACTQPTSTTPASAATAAWSKAGDRLAVAIDRDIDRRLRRCVRGVGDAEQEARPTRSPPTRRRLSATSRSSATAGKDAGEDIERGLGGGFDDAESAGTRALATLSSKLDGLESDIKGTASAVKAIGDNLDDGFDSSRIEAMVGDLRKMGVTFDEIEAKAKEFADVIQRADGIKLDAVNSGLTNVGSSLDKVTGSADQSRSVHGEHGRQRRPRPGRARRGRRYARRRHSASSPSTPPKATFRCRTWRRSPGRWPHLPGPQHLSPKRSAPSRPKMLSTLRWSKISPTHSAKGETVAGQLRDTILETGELEFATGLFGGGGFLGISSEMQNLIPLFNELGINYDEFMQLLADPTGYEQLRALRDTWLDMALNAPTTRWPTCGRPTPRPPTSPPRV